jgi:hypothetical protein
MSDSDDIQLEIPTFWQRYPPTVHWAKHVRALDYAREHHMPITQAVFDRIPDHDAYCSYYVYLCRWPTAHTLYRNSERTRRLHRRTVLEGLVRYSRNCFTFPCLFDYWGVLLQLNPSQVFEEALGFLRNQQDFVMGVDRCITLCKSFRSIEMKEFTTWVMNSENLHQLQEYVENYIVPYRREGETSYSTQVRTEFIRNVLYNVFIPEFTAQRLEVYEKATQRLSVYKDELLAHAWDYPRYIANCLDESEARELINRWSFN